MKFEVVEDFLLKGEGCQSFFDHVVRPTWGTHCVNSIYYRIETLLSRDHEIKSLKLVQWYLKYLRECDVQNSLSSLNGDQRHVIQRLILQALTTLWDHKVSIVEEGVVEQSPQFDKFNKFTMSNLKLANKDELLIKDEDVNGASSMDTVDFTGLIELLTWAFDHQVSYFQEFFLHCFKTLNTPEHVDLFRDVVKGVDYTGMGILEGTSETRDGTREDISETGKKATNRKSPLTSPKMARSSRSSMTGDKLEYDLGSSDAYAEYKKQRYQCGSNPDENHVPESAYGNIIASRERRLSQQSIGNGNQDSGLDGVSNAVASANKYATPLDPKQVAMGLIKETDIIDMLLYSQPAREDPSFRLRIAREFLPRFMKDKNGISYPENHPFKRVLPHTISTLYYDLNAWEDALAICVLYPEHTVDFFGYNDFELTNAANGEYLGNEIFTFDEAPAFHKVEQIEVASTIRESSEQEFIPHHRSSVQDYYDKWLIKVDTESPIIDRKCSILAGIASSNGAASSNGPYRSHYSSAYGAHGNDPLTRLSQGKLYNTNTNVAKTEKDIAEEIVRYNFQGKRMLRSAWTILKRGLMIGTTKKRAKFLVDRIVEEKEFNWFWAIFDGVGEFASHWIKQNWNKIEELIEKARKASTYTNPLVSEKQGSSQSRFESDLGKQSITPKNQIKSKIALNLPWVEFLLQLCIEHENDSVTRFVLERLVQSEAILKVQNQFSDYFVFKILMPKLTEHGWYLNNTTEENEKMVKRYFKRLSPHKILKAMSSVDINYFVPLRIFLEILDESVNKSEGKRVKNFWTTKEFSYGLLIIEKQLRSMPRGVRMKILNLLVKVFVNNFDPNHPEDLSIKESTTSSTSTSTIEVAGESRSETTPKLDPTLATSYEGVHSENQDAVSILHKHILMIRFFAAIPSDVIQSHLFQQIQCQVEFDEVLRSLWFFILQEDDQAFSHEDFLQNLGHHHAADIFGYPRRTSSDVAASPRTTTSSNYPQKAMNTQEYAAQKEEIKEIVNDPHNSLFLENRSLLLENYEQQLALSYGIDASRMSACSLTQRRLLLEVNKLLISQKLITLPYSRVVCVGLARIMKSSSTNFMDLTAMNSIGDDRYSDRYNEEGVVQKSVVAKSVQSSLIRFGELLENLYSKTYLPRGVAQHVVLLFNILHGDGVVGCYSASRAQYDSTRAGPDSVVSHHASSAITHNGKMDYYFINSNGGPVIKVNTDSLVQYCLVAMQDRSRTWEDASLLVSALHRVELPSHVLPDMTKLIMKSLRGEQAILSQMDMKVQTTRKMDRHSVYSTGTAAEIMFGLGGTYNHDTEASDGIGRLKRAFLPGNDDPTTAFVGLSLAGITFKALKRNLPSKDLIHVERVVDGRGNPLRELESPLLNSETTMKTRTAPSKMKADRHKAASNILYNIVDSRLTSDPRYALDNIALNEILNTLYPFMHKQLDFKKFEQNAQRQAEGGIKIGGIHSQAGSLSNPPTGDRPVGFKLPGGSDVQVHADTEDDAKAAIKALKMHTPLPTDREYVRAYYEKYQKPSLHDRDLHPSEVIAQQGSGYLAGDERKSERSGGKFKYIAPISHYLEHSLRSVWNDRFEKLSSDGVRLLNEGMPVIPGGGIAANNEGYTSSSSSAAAMPTTSLDTSMLKTSARLSCEWHKWRSLFAIFVENPECFNLDDLIDAFESSTPPEAGFLAQMIGMTDCNVDGNAGGERSDYGTTMLHSSNSRTDDAQWNLEKLKRITSIVGGFVANPSQDGFDYAILSEACFAAFNVNTIRAELKIIKEAENLGGNYSPTNFNEFPLLKLMSTIMISGESQVNMTRAAILPLLGSLAEVSRNAVVADTASTSSVKTFDKEKMENSTRANGVDHNQIAENMECGEDSKTEETKPSSSSLPKPYIHMLAKILLYNEAVLRDASRTIGEIDLVPFANTGKMGTHIHHFQADDDHQNQITDQKESHSEKVPSGGEEQRKISVENSKDISPSGRALRNSVKPTLTYEGLLESIFQDRTVLSVDEHPVEGLAHHTQPRDTKKFLSETSAFVRLSTLCFLESAAKTDVNGEQLATDVVFALIGFLDEVLVKSVTRENKRKDKLREKDPANKTGHANQKPLVPNNLSEYHRMQLRAWQSIVVLIPRVTTSSLKDLVAGVMRHFSCPQLPDVRTYQEYALCLLGIREEDQARAEIKARPVTKVSINSDEDGCRSEVAHIFHKDLTAILSDIATGTPQVLASAAIVAGYWLKHCPSLLKKDHVARLLLPYMTSNIALIRGTAQLVFYQIYESDYYESESKELSSRDIPDFARQMMRMLTEHKDTIKMRKRLGLGLQRWNPRVASQIDAMFAFGAAPASNTNGGAYQPSGGQGESSGNSMNDKLIDEYTRSELDTVYDYRPKYMFIQEIKSMIDIEMQEMWHAHTGNEQQALGQIHPDEMQNIGLNMRQERIDREKMRIGDKYLSSQTCRNPALIETAITPGVISAVENHMIANEQIGFQRKFDPLKAQKLEIEVEKDQIPTSTPGGSSAQAMVDDLFFSLLNESSKLRSRQRRKLIVCASLVDKIPNLGGLSRTCEIFNVEGLTVHNKDVVKDPNFSSISVTAEKWMPMWEVTPSNIASFLLQQKQNGYTIVGVEQTHNSVSLDKFNFSDYWGQGRPPQSNNQEVVLLLGAEKEGLPAELIHLCDVCVEIPQAGMLRSLNVHVSASLLIWEYVREYVRHVEGKKMVD